MIPEADIFVRWNDGKVMRVGKISTEELVDRVKVRCSNLYRGLGWAFIRTGIRMMFILKQKGEEEDAVG